MYIVVKIDKTNFPCTEPEDVSVRLFETCADARRWMKSDFDRTCRHETEELRTRDAFKNSDDHEVMWVVRQGKPRKS